MNNKIIISDTGPLISLAKTGQLFILKELFEQVLIPKAVHDELYLESHHKETDDLNKAIIDKWIKVVIPKKAPSKLLLNSLDIGESEAITVAKEMNIPLLIDEQKGRKVAKKENVKITGSIGILLIAKKKGVLKNVRKSMQKMQDTGYRFSKKLYKKALFLADEEL